MSQSDLAPKECSQSMPTKRERISVRKSTLVLIGQLVQSCAIVKYGDLNLKYQERFAT